MEVSAGQIGQSGLVLLVVEASLAGEILSCIALAQVKIFGHVHVPFHLTQRHD